MIAMDLRMMNGRLRGVRVAELVACVAVLAYPAITLTVQGGVNVVMAVMFFAAIAMLVSSGKKFNEHFADLDSRLFAMAMMSGAAAILANQLSYMHFDPGPFDSEFRFLLAIFIFVALRQVRQNLAKVLELAIPLGVWVTLLASITWYEQNARIRTDFLDAIHIGEVSMLLGFFSLFMMNGVRKDGWYMLMFKSAAFLVGIYIVVRTGARGVWLAFPLLLMFGYATQSWRPVSIRAALAAIAGLCLAAYLSIGIVQQRVDLTFSSVDSYLSGKVKDGTAARIELWRVALSLLGKHPLTGIEQGSLPEMLQQMHDRGEINNLVLIEGRAEMHSEMAARMAKYGILGLLSAIFILAVPGWMFIRSMKSEDRIARMAARMGLALILSLFIFGLTVEIFNIKMMAAFYALTMAVLMALARPPTTSKIE